MEWRLTDTHEIHAGGLRPGRTIFQNSGEPGVDRVIRAAPDGRFEAYLVRKGNVVGGVSVYDLLDDAKAHFNRDA
jgi:hypothetical protein